MKKTIDGIVYDNQTATAIREHIAERFLETLTVTPDGNVFLWCSGDGYDPETAEDYEPGADCIIIPMNVERTLIWIAARGGNPDPERRNHSATLARVKNTVEEYGAPHYADEQFTRICNDCTVYAFYSR